MNYCKTLTLPFAIGLFGLDNHRLGKDGTKHC